MTDQYVLERHRRIQAIRKGERKRAWKWLLLGGRPVVQPSRQHITNEFTTMTRNESRR